MIVSWNWLKQYVRLDMPAERLADRLMMSGLNVDDKPGEPGVFDVDGDIGINIEVTSNRPDCLAHIGVAREISVLFDSPLTIPLAQPQEEGPPASSLTTIRVDCPDLCPQYTARIIRGVKIGPSPYWMQARLKTAGIRPVNNVVDATNYVLFECGQPLHAFDFDRLAGRKLTVRRATAGEKITAIDQREYALRPEMCVIADERRAVAVAGVMGGLDTEISDATTNVLLEVAEFAPMSVRSAARTLDLHSPSSFRFERGVDRQNLDWASRRCAELILEVAGGELCAGAVVTGTPPQSGNDLIALRFSEIPRILGITIPESDVVRILTALGLPLDSRSARDCRFVAPSWRRDLTREVDLIEEVARIHGYDKIPEDVPVPMALSALTAADRLASRLAERLTAAGFFEAVTVSFTTDDDVRTLAPWDDEPAKIEPLKVEHSTRNVENCLRRSLLPSLLRAREYNQRQGNAQADLFELARVYHGDDPSQPDQQPRLLALVTGRSFLEVKGILEDLARAVAPNHALTAEPAVRAGFSAGRVAEVTINGQRLAWFGEVADDIRGRFDLRETVCAAELKLDVLEAIAQFSPQFVPPAENPGIERDINFVIDESITFAELANLVREHAGPSFETVTFDSQYRGQQIPAGKKSYVLRVSFRAPDRTLTGDEADSAVQSIVQAAASRLQATQR